MNSVAEYVSFLEILAGSQASTDSGFWYASVPVQGNMGIATSEPGKATCM